jgi:hypothetical protein
VADFRQIQAILNERTLIDSTSTAYVGMTDFVKIDCVLSSGNVRAYENGLIRLDRCVRAEVDEWQRVVFIPHSAFCRDTNDDRNSKSSESFQFSQNRGRNVHFEVRNVAVTEQNTPRSVPTFCPATGNFYQVT